MILNLLHESGCKKLDASMHVYICDHARIKRLKYGFHRLHHVLSFCVSQHIDVYEGDSYETCQQLIQEFNITDIIVQECDDVELVKIMNAFSSQVNITWIKNEFESLIQSPPHASFFSFFKMIQPVMKKRGLYRE